MQSLINQQVKVHVNSIIGALPAVVVRDMTDDAFAATSANPLPGENVFEVRYTGGPHTRSYAFVPARDLR